MSADRAQVCDTQSLRSALIEAIHTATRRHGLAPTGTDHCLCGGWVEGDDWDEHLAPVSLDAVLPLIADAIEADAHALKHRITAASADLGRPLARTMLSEVDGRILAARLVRSLLGTDSDATASPSSAALPETGE